ncbi:MAG: hypothetical protein JST24_10540 [Acidobacteria bacterium]|nr:hypothetical protein [Acidobacteriota bacterium]
MNRAILASAMASISAFAAIGATPSLPLPPAPVRVIIPDPAAFDQALHGSYRLFLTGASPEDDPVVSAWRKTQVGSKLEDQWARLSKDLPWTWEQIRALRPTAVGLSLIQVGHLEAVLVVDTPLATLPMPLKAGTPRVYRGVSYAFVTKGAADEGANPDRRMGFAWARSGGHLLLATSERALKLSLDELQAGKGFEAPMPGLIAMDLDLDALRKDRYFRREFLFAQGPEQGHVLAALRDENGHLVEVRVGTGDARPGVFTFTASNAAAEGWEPEGATFWPAFRRGLLEPIPQPLDLPVHAIAPLPSVGGPAGDAYTEDFTKPLVSAGGPAFELGDLAPWKALLASHPIPSWGYWVGKDGVRRMALPWPASEDAAFMEACRATAARRAGRAVLVKAGGGEEIQVGPGLPALAFRRIGSILWVAPSLKDLTEAPTPHPDSDLLRWAEVDLGAVRAEAPRWAKAEGPAQPEQVRPLSDRILGILGWMPNTTSIRVERRRTSSGWTERVVFGTKP